MGDIDARNRLIEVAVFRPKVAFLAVGQRDDRNRCQGFEGPSRRAGVGRQLLAEPGRRNARVRVIVIHQKRALVCAGLERRGDIARAAVRYVAVLRLGAVDFRDCLDGRGNGGDFGGAKAVGHKTIPVVVCQSHVCDVGRETGVRRVVVEFPKTWVKLDFERNAGGRRAARRVGAFDVEVGRVVGGQDILAAAIDRGRDSKRDFGRGRRRVRRVGHGFAVDHNVVGRRGQ